MLLAACEQFLGKAEQEIRRVALETLGEIFYFKSSYYFSNVDNHLNYLLIFLSSISEGHQRAIMGSMTVEVTYLLLLIDYKRFFRKTYVPIPLTRSGQKTNFVVLMVKRRKILLMRGDINPVLRVFDNSE